MSETYSETCKECYPLALTAPAKGAQWCSHRGWHEVAPYVSALEHATSDRERLMVAAEIARVFS